MMTSVYTSPVYGAVPSQLISTIFGLFEYLSGSIKYAKFHINRLRGSLFGGIPVGQREVIHNAVLKAY
jgi:hypothetical protein